MPVSITHETGALLLRENPGLAALFRTLLGMKIPEDRTPVLGSEDCTVRMCSGFSALKGDGKHHLENLMMNKDFEYTSDFALRLIAQGKAQGVAQGEAKSILLFLKARGVPVTQHARDRIRACTDPQQLERWVERAAFIENIDELFADESS